MKQITEVARKDYDEWGIINHKGEVVTGHDHPSAMTHADLWKRIPGHMRHKAVEYAKSKVKSELLVRTCSREGLVNALKNWSRFPQGCETVVHDHTDNGSGINHYGDSSHPHKVMLKMNQLINRYD